jgi:hypothetical protein
LGIYFYAYFGAYIGVRARFVTHVVDFQDYDRAAERPISRTKGGYTGLGRPLAAAGDQIMLCKGGKLPLVLREVGGTRNWELIGDSYVHGMTNGELWDESKCERL